MIIFRKAMFVAALVVILLLSCGCDEGKCGEDILEVSSAVSSEQVYPVGSYERRAAEFAASGADITGREVTDFGEESIFGGIQVESDDNGEPVCTESDGALRFRITDKRFISIGSLTAFVKKHSGAAEAERLRVFFREREGALYLTLGEDGRNVKYWRRYYMNDPVRLTVQAVHSDACRRKYGVLRSDVCFVQEDGVWKLDRLTVTKE